MPIFGSKFSPKKTPVRKNALDFNNEEPLEELVNDNHVITLKLGQQECYFENGDWIPENGTGGRIHKNTQRLRDKIAALEEENYMLKLKYELMLNMLTETAAENHIQEREIQKLKTPEPKRRYK